MQALKVLARKRKKKRALKSKICIITAAEFLCRQGWEGAGLDFYLHKIYNSRKYQWTILNNGERVNN